MLSSVLNSERAGSVNIKIMRAFVRLRQVLATNANLARRLDELESKYDQQFKVVFDAIRELMSPPTLSRKQIGFGSRRKKNFVSKAQWLQCLAATAVPQALK